MDITNLSAPEATEYEPETFFQFYDIVLEVDETQSSWFSTTEYLLLTSIASYLRDDVDTEAPTEGDDRLSKLQEFLVTPILVFNNVVYGGPVENMGRTATLAVPSYKVVLLLISRLLLLVGYISGHTRYVHGRRLCFLVMVFSGTVLVLICFDSKCIPLS